MFKPENNGITEIFKKTDFNRQALIPYRYLFLFVALVVPGFWFVYHVLEPRAIDSLYVRLALSAMFLALFTATFFISFVKKNIYNFAFASYFIVSIWILKLNYDNSFSELYILGLILIYFVVCIAIRDTFQLAVYSITMNVAVILLINEFPFSGYTISLLSVFSLTFAIICFMVLLTRNKIQNDLEISSSLLSSIFHESGDAILIVDIGTKTIIDCNHQALDLFEINSKNKFRTDSEIQRMMKENLDSLFETDSFDDTSKNFLGTKLSTASGKTVWADISGKELPLRNRKILLITIVDTSDRRKADESSRKVSEQRKQLLEVSKKLNSTLSEDEIIKQIAASLTKVLQYDGCILYKMDPVKGVMYPLVLKSSGIAVPELSKYAIPITKGIAGAVFEKKSGEIVNYAHLDPRSIYLSELHRKFEHLISIPLVNKENVVAVFSVVRDADPPFTEDEFELVQLFVSQASIALENARLFKEVQNEALHTHAIIEVTNAINSTMDVNRLLDLIVEKVLNLTNSTEGGLFLVNEIEQTLSMVSNQGRNDGIQHEIKLRMGEGIAGWVAQTGDPVLIKNAHTDPNYSVFRPFEHIQSIISIPLFNQGKVVGVLSISRVTGEPAFTEDDYRIAQNFAHQAALALDNVRLFDEIRISEEKYRSMFEETEEVVIFTDIDGKILDINPAGVKLYGFDSKEELLAIPSIETLYADKINRAPYIEEMLSKGFVKNLEVEMKRKDGGKLFLLETSFAVRDEFGNISFFRGILRDITERRKLEQQFFQSQKMESIGLLAGGIAHDFNNILSGILGYASLIKTGIDENHKYFKYVDSMEKSALRAAELTSQLLAFARGGKYVTKLFGINEVVTETMTILARTFSKSIDIEMFLEENLPMIEGDPSQMQQVTLNLCVNARDAIKGSGKIIIETNKVVLEEGEASTKSELKPGTYVTVSVTDTGIGMDKETLQRIYEPFFTTKEVGKGTGLGLAMVYGVVKNHEGLINVYSEVGEGTTFMIYLPAITDSENNSNAKPDSSKDGNLTETLYSKNHDVVLVVDDEESLQALLFDVLSNFGYRVLSAQNGIEALKIYNAHKDDINIVILDMVMPKLGGYETFLELKKINPNVKTILSSGFSQNIQTQEMMNSGVSSFIQKPYQVNELLKKVKQAIYG